jgi:undecaprenyl diphosphate synthase
MNDQEENTPLRIPQHLAIIMDGNGRWAKARGLPRLAGHRAGTENLRRIIRACREFGIPILTIYAFSTENWHRPQAEVRGLLNILEQVIDRELDDLNKNGVQLRHLGTLEGVEPRMQAKVAKAIEVTRQNHDLILNIAFNYGGRDEILQAVRRVIRDGVPPEDITPELFSNYMYTAGLPDPDLIVRTSGELRTSNFLVWQSYYAEWYFTPTYWPDFDKEQLRKVLEFYSRRQRRYGLLDEQVIEQDKPEERGEAG